MNPCAVSDEVALSAKSVGSERFMVDAVAALSDEVEWSG